MSRRAIVQAEATEDQKGLHCPTEAVMHKAFETTSLQTALPEGDGSLAEADCMIHLTHRAKRFCCVVGCVLASAFAMWHARPSCGGATDAGMQAYTETIPGTKVSFTMVPIPAGEFDMGSPAGDPGHRSDEAPVHRV